MDFFVGLIDKISGVRYVLRGKADPAISVLDLSDGGKSAESFDWGETATQDASRCLAYLLLAEVGGSDTAKKYCFEYGDTIVRKSMKSGTGWLLDSQEVEKWLLGKRGVQ